MPRHILITGGAGFIGSHLADELLRNGYRVRVLDSLSDQVHGPGQQRPEYLHEDVELMVGDIRDPQAVRNALDGIDAVFHLAAAVGVGQSMYEVEAYTSTNNVGTAVLLEGILKHHVERLIVASSMSIYGEGLYRDAEGLPAAGARRSMEQLRGGMWEVLDEHCHPLAPVPTPETKPPDLSSVYALSKWDQERLCLIVGQAYDLPTVALRFFNVFGTRQALSNPYTGVLAIFAARLLNNNAPLVYEDGMQKRDFVAVEDVALACRLALETPAAAGEVFNIGSGNACSILEIAEQVARVMGKNIEPVVTGKYRMGDIRHCFADISLARQVLGYSPRITFKAGLGRLAQWLEGQVASDRVEQATAELEARGLTV